MVPQKVEIEGWPYYITIEGKVFRNGSNKPLKPYEGRDGYSVTLSDGKKRKNFRLNNLMRNAYFKGTRLPIKHLNRDKLDFSYWNLKPMPRNKISKAERKHGWVAKAVIETLPDGTENIYPSGSECARIIHVSASSVRAWCNGKKRTESMIINIDGKINNIIF